MTVFETGNFTMQLASLAMQKETLELQQASLALQESALAVQRASVWVAAVVGAAKCIVAGHGLFALHRYYNHSAEQHRKNMKAIERRRQEDMAEHGKTMRALEDRNNAMMELIRRTPAQEDG